MPPNDVARLIDAGGQPGYVAPNWIGRPHIWELVHAKWQVSSQAGRAPLLAADEQAAYGFIYALFADVAADQDREQIVWAHLRALEGLARPSSGLNDSKRLELQEARLVNTDIKGLAKILDKSAAELKIARQPAERSGASGICFATNTSRADALARLAAEVGHPIDEP
jgi:hypothetical protein